jgi:hypothetical protein
VTPDPKHAYAHLLPSAAAHDVANDGSCAPRQLPEHQSAGMER